MVAVGAMPESNATRADANSPSPWAGGNCAATDTAPPMLSPASAL
jgi:hypothetical protein